ncbi:MAG: SDR family oxidoreductase [Atribacterales bacterium]
MDLGFKDKVVIVTGGASGIGEATCRLFAQEGAKVALFDIDDIQGGKVAREIREAEGKCEAIKVDVTSEKDVQKAVNIVEEKMGAPHILVNNAGLYRKGDVLSFTNDDLEKLIGVNIQGVLFCSKYAAEKMKDKNYGVIVNVASEAGIVAIANQIIYNLTKAAVISITKSCAVDLASHGIRVNCVCPGTTFTPLVAESLKGESDPERTRRALEESRPLRRLGKPEEIASAILFLSSDAAGYATGAVLSVDGGYTVW